MCGILGASSHTNNLGQDERLRLTMLALRHRGPNDSGLEHFPVMDGRLSLGQTRLSVIDLSVGGHQPFHGADGRYVMVFNGEIYNYLELRRELVTLGFQFKSESDTEVLLNAWIAWGADCLSRFIGMFAFAVLDREKATLTCVRDAFGIKPLYYTQEGDDFLFASEVPALLTLKSHNATVNWQSAYDYLVHGAHDCNEQTFFADIKQLLPGHLLVVNLAEHAVGIPLRWWMPQIAEHHGLSLDAAAEQVRECFLKSIRLNLRSDVALGAALSGGVDSSAIVCAMRYVEPDVPINTFSFVAKDSPVDEEKWVDIVNQHVGANVHKLSIAPDELVNDLDRLILAQGEPFGSMSIYAQYRVYQQASENGVTVTLDGQGADEILGGYVGFPGERVHSLLDQKLPGEALAFVNAWAKWPGRSKATAFQASLAELSAGSIHELMRWATGMNRVPGWVRWDVADEMGITPRFGRFRSGADAHGRRLVAQLLNMLTRHGLPTLLRFGDRNSMSFSVESRVPFLSLDLVELMLSMPERYLVSAQGETKHVFRKAMQGIVPDEVLFRKDKIGFEPPEKDWLFAIAGQAREWLSEDPSIPFVDGRAVLRQFDEVIAGKRAFTWQVWRWINFYRWKSCFVD